MEDHAADVKALLDDRGLETRGAGRVEHGRVRGPGLRGSLAGTPGRPAAGEHPGTADGEEAQRGREDTAQRALAGGVPVIARGMVPTLLSEATRGRHPELAAEVEALIARQRPEAVAAAARGMALRPDRHAVLGSLDVPVLVMRPASTDHLDAPAHQPGPAGRSTRVASGRGARCGPPEQPGGPEAFNAAVPPFLAGL